jgi:hypothetical protein
MTGSTRMGKRPQTTTHYLARKAFMKLHHRWSMQSLGMMMQSTCIVGQYFTFKRLFSLTMYVNTIITIALNFVASLTIDDTMDSRCCMSSLMLLIIHLK